MSKDFEESRQALQDRFPDLRCVRCGSDKFLLRVWNDPALAPAFQDQRVVEVVCENCGFVERHLLDGLKGSLKETWEKASAD